MDGVMTFINRFRGFFLNISTLLMRWIFLGATFGLMVLGARLDPKIEYIFRSEWDNRLRGPNRDLVDIDFRSDGNWLAGASNDGSIYIWDFNNFENLTREQRRPIELPLGEGNPTQVKFTPGGYLVSAGTNEELRVWLTNTLRQGSISAYQAHTQDLDSDDPFLNSFTLDRHTSVVDKLVLSPNQRWLASADVSGKIVIWNTGLLGIEEKVEETAIELDLNGFPIIDIEFSPSGRFLAISDVSNSIFLLDMNLIDNPYQFANERLVLKQYGDTVHDIVFDEPATNQEPNRYLFAAGPENSIVAYNLIDLSATPVTFPFAHEGIPQHLQIIRDSGIAEVASQYWLTSLDENGTVVFWDINRLLGVGFSSNPQNFYEYQIMSQKPLSLQTSFARNRPVGDTSRSLLIAGSPDHSVRVLDLSVEPGSWQTIQLRSVFGRINDIDFSAGNQYLASAANHRVRIWEVDDISNYQNAVPWRARFQFLAPIVLVYVLLMHAAATYIMRVYGLGSRVMALRFLMNAMFGFYFETWIGFILSLFWPVFPRARVEDGRLQRDPDRFEYVDIIGGPGRINIRPGNVVAFQTNRMQTAVVTNLTYWMRPFERVRNIINLEDQYFEVDSLETYTRDGIKVTLKNVRARYRVPHTGAREEWAELRQKFIATGETARIRRNLAKAFDQMTMQNVEEIIVLYRLNSQQANYLRKVEDLIEQDKLLYINRAPNEYGNVDREALQKAIDNLYWEKAVERALAKRIRFFINRHPLDYFTAPGRINHGEDEPNGHFRLTFREESIKETNVVLKAVGAEVLWMDVGTFEIKRKEIETARHSLWHWKAVQDAERLRSEGQAAKEKARAQGRIECEGEIISNLTAVLNQLRPYMTKNGALPETRRRAMTYSRMAGILRKYLSKAKSDGTFPPPWLNNQNSKNTNKPPEKG